MITTPSFLKLEMGRLCLNIRYIAWILNMTRKMLFRFVSRTECYLLFILHSSEVKLYQCNISWEEKKKMNFLLCLKSLSLRHKNWAYFLFWTFQMISLVLFYTCHFPSLLLSIYSFTHKESRKLRTLIFPSLLCSSYLWFLSKHTCAVNYWGVVS